MFVPAKCVEQLQFGWLYEKTDRYLKNIQSAPHVTSTKGDESLHAPLTQINTAVTSTVSGIGHRIHTTKKSTLQALAVFTKFAARGDAYLSKRSSPFTIYHMLQSLSHMLLTQGWKPKSSAP